MKSYEGLRSLRLFWLREIANIAPKSPFWKGRAPQLAMCDWAHFIKQNFSFIYNWLHKNPNSCTLLGHREGAIFLYTQSLRSQEISSPNHWFYLLSLSAFKMLVWTAKLTFSITQRSICCISQKKKWKMCFRSQWVDHKHSKSRHLFIYYLWNSSYLVQG